MNLIATRAVLKRTHGNSNSSCRHCGSTETETLPHVLQHCPHNEVSIRARHDLSLRRIAAAIAKADSSCRLLVEQPLPEFTDALLKPNIILVDDANKTAAICDLAVSFDDGNIQGSGLTGFQTRAAETRLASSLSPLPKTSMPLIEALQQSALLNGIRVSPSHDVAMTAFADDIKIYSRSRAGIAKLHFIMAAFLDWTTMRANPGKCMSLGVRFDGRRHVPDNVGLTIHGGDIRAISLDDSYCYLGVREGFDHFH
ncbi:hypothetical protein H310_15404, partial [Aphanomyces invadans]